MFERKRQYSSLFGRLKADHGKVCELQQSGTAHLPDIVHMTKSPRPSPSSASDQNQEVETAGNSLETILVLVPTPSETTLMVRLQV